MHTRTNQYVNIQRFIVMKGYTLTDIDIRRNALAHIDSLK